MINRKLAIDACKIARSSYEKAEYESYCNEKNQILHDESLSFFVKLFKSFHIKEKKIASPPKLFNYNADLITDSHFIAAKGPQNEYEFEQLLNNMLCNKNTSFKINDIICLGNENFDFLNYISPKENLQLNNYIVTANVVSENALFTESTLKVSFNNSDRIENVNVTQFKVLNGDIIKNYFRSSQTKEERDLIRQQIKKLIALARIVAEKMTLVHCMNGRGRTGHLILLIELFLHADKIFLSNDPHDIARSALEELNRIRKTRPSLISNTRQFVFALYNAFILYTFDLELNNKNIIREKPQKTSIPCSHFKPRNDEDMTKKDELKSSNHYRYV